MLKFGMRVVFVVGLVIFFLRSDIVLVFVRKLVYVSLVLFGSEWFVVR